MEQLTLIREMERRMGLGPHMRMRRDFRCRRAGAMPSMQQHAHQGGYSGRGVRNAWRLSQGVACIMALEEP